MVQLLQDYPAALKWIDMKKLVYLIGVLGMAVSCTAGGIFSGEKAGMILDGMASSDRGLMPGESEGQGGGEAGVLTAGEWNDLQNWDFWGKLMTTPAQEGDDGQGTADYGKMAADWGFNTAHRIAVKVKQEDGTPAANVKVELLKGGAPVWTTCTANDGSAQLWHDLFSAKGQETPTDGLQLRIGGVLQSGTPEVCSYTSAPVNEYTVSVAAPASKADVAFIVDATGSMGDEIAFLKKDLLSILKKVQQSQAGVEIRTGAVFYRDEGDLFLTRVDNFTTPASTMSFIGKQAAEGGGDLPEAVHSALEAGLQKLSWNASARARIAFLILDAPAHIDHDGVVMNLQNSIRSYAAQGIRIVPVVASTGDKTTEFMCRDFAIVTGGTYVFLTDDSGVGESHLIPTVGDYEIEKLNDLLYRLLDSYIR